MGRDGHERQAALLALDEEPGAGPDVGPVQMRVADVGGEEFDIAPGGLVAEVGDQRRHDIWRSQIGSDLGLT